MYLGSEGWSQITHHLDLHLDTWINSHNLTPAIRRSDEPFCIFPIPNFAFVEPYFAVGIPISNNSISHRVIPITKLPGYRPLQAGRGGGGDKSGFTVQLYKCNYIFIVNYCRVNLTKYNHLLSVTNIADYLDYLVHHSLDVCGWAELHIHCVIYQMSMSITISQDHKARLSQANKPKSAFI